MQHRVKYKDCTDVTAKRNLVRNLLQCAAMVKMAMEGNCQLLYGFGNDHVADYLHKCYSRINANDPSKNNFHPCVDIGTYKPRYFGTDCKQWEYLGNSPEVPTPINITYGKIFTQSAARYKNGLPKTGKKEKSKESK